MGLLMEKLSLLLYANMPFWTDGSSTILELRKIGIQANCTAIPCPIINPVISRLPKKEKQLTCIFVSRIVRMKGVEEVIKAFALLKREKKEAKLWIVGRGKEAYIQYLKRMVKDYHIESSVVFLVW